MIAARQEVTREWWETADERFDLVVSPMVLDEADQGDPAVASSRLAAVAGMQVLPVSDDVLRRVEDLRGELGLPEKALADV